MGPIINRPGNKLRHLQAIERRFLRRQGRQR